MGAQQPGLGMQTLVVLYLKRTRTTLELEAAALLARFFMPAKAKVLIFQLDLKTGYTVNNPKGRANPGKI